MEWLACKAMLIRLGFSNATSLSIYDDQAINSIDEFRYLDDGSVKTLCKVLRQPGGVAANGDPDPGVKVDARAESNLMIDAYLIKH